MKGYEYSCVWVVKSRDSEPPSDVIHAHTRALWVPDAQLLIQWVPPDGTMQVSEPKEFPPPLSEARVTLLGEQHVSFATVKEARGYLEHRKSRQAEQVAVQTAMNRLMSLNIYYEGRLQRALKQDGIRA